MQQPNAAQDAEQQRGALVAIDRNSDATGDAAAGDAQGGQAAMTAVADKQPQPEDQAAAPAAVS
eukprot:581984-Prymnesium_polylepis.1